MTTLSTEEQSRYARHVILPEVGVAGQERLRSAKVLLVGSGGLGSPISLYLAAAGVGTLGLVDFDRVDLTNLHRQIVHGTSDIGRPKVESARDRLRDINPNVAIRTWDVALSAANALEILRDYDVIVDGTDNFPTRYLVNDACVLLGKPNVYGAIFRFEGQASIFATSDGPCYRCLYPAPPPPGLVPSCAEGGVLGVLPGIIGLIQATETVKLLLGIGESLAGRLLLFDALRMSFRELRLRKEADCPVCGTNPTITALIDYDQFCRGDEAEMIQEPTTSEPTTITPAELHARIERGEGPKLVDVREQNEWDLCRLEGAVLIPLGQIEPRMSELDPHEEIVIYCRSGARSGRAADIMRASGFRRVLNLVGGINRWSRDVDPSVPLY